MINDFGYVGKLFTDSYTRMSRKPMYLAFRKYQQVVWFYSNRCDCALV